MRSILREQLPIKDCVLNYECLVIDDSKSNMSSHHYFFGKILTAYASNEIIT